MKSMTIWQRLNTALLLLIILLVAVFGLALWVERTRLDSDIRTQQMTDARDRIYKDVMLFNNALRGTLLDPRNDPDQIRRGEPEKELKDSYDYLQKIFQEYPE